MKKAKFEVTVKATTGTLDGELFKLMAARGDVTSTSIKELVNYVSCETLNYYSNTSS